MTAKEALKFVVSLMMRADSPTLFAIAGGSCSGKSYFTGELLSALDDLFLTAAVVPLDDYFKDMDDPSLPRNSEGRRLFDVPESYHEAEFISAVTDLMKGREVFVPAYDMAKCKRVVGAGKNVKPGNIVVVEGLFAISMLQKNDLTGATNIFIDAREDLRLKRRIERDVLRFGTSEERVRKIFFEKVKPYHEKHIEPQKRYSDIVIVQTKYGGEV